MVDFSFVGGKEWVDVSLVKETGALGLRQDKVGKEDETEEGVEGEPV